jgi:acyl-CoA synthetase (NDP forming)
MADSRKVGLNKAVSYGNQIDLTVEEYLEYFAEDDSVKVVAAYIEDVKDGKRFLRALSRLTASKPLVILKGGTTSEGARAAASHTGALAGQHAVWAAAMRQNLCIEVETQKQAVDVVMLASSDKIPRGPRIVYMGAGGGTSVLFTDLAVEAGLSIPELGQKTQEAIGEKISDVNTCTTNPVDLGAFGFDPDVVIHTLETVDTENGIDAMILYITLDYMSMFEAERVESGLGAIAEVAAACRRPVIPILPKSAENDPRMEEIRLLALTVFRENGLPMFNSLQEAVTAISSLLLWSAGNRGEQS